MKKVANLFIVSLCLMLFYTNTIVQAQQAVDEKKEVYNREHIKDKMPVPYPAIREADVLWEKTIWRMIDLRHRQNLPLYYPASPVGNRMSLIDLLLYGINNEGLNAYSPDDPNATTEFDVLMTREQVDIAMDALPDTVEYTDENGMIQTEVMEGVPNTQEVKQFLIKEKWYFDKQHSVMRVRIVGLCPIRLYTREDNPDILKSQVMWIYYPEARPLMVNYEIFNSHNDAQRLSFDDFFTQRRFNGFVFAESNVHNNRYINEYKQGLEIMHEAERIDNYIFNVEHDMWEY
jgi:gliding motility associated protien GldN